MARPSWWTKWVAVCVFMLVGCNSDCCCLALQPQHQQQNCRQSVSHSRKEDPQISLPLISRRRLLWEESIKMMVSVGVTTATIVAGKPQPALAARGAAELDLEFYVRDLVGGNKKEGNILPSAPPVVSPPRTLQGPLLPLLLNDDCSSACIPTQALIELLSNTNSNKSASSLEKMIQDSVNGYRERTSRSFASRSPWKDEHVSDQYYFDFTSYALWRTAADMIPNYTNRDIFVRSVGRKLYQQIRSNNLIRASPKAAGSSGGSSGTKQPLQDSLQDIIQVLDLFQSSGFCKGYRIRTQDTDIVTTGKNDNNSDKVFDELDEDSLLSGMSVDCLVSIYEPATLGASLQITGEQSRFSPDYIGPTLAAIWEEGSAHGGGDVKITSSWETLFVDPVYRPNPKDYFPNEQLLQYTLTKGK